MHFLVLGATGHTLTLFVRSRSKVPTKVADNKKVAIIEGTLEDEDTLDEVSRCGADTFVSFAGPPVGNQGTHYRLKTLTIAGSLKALTNGYRALIPKLVSQGIKRVLVLCTPSYKGTSDVASFKWRLGEWTMKAIPSTRGQYGEMIHVGAYITTLPAEDGIKWTLFRVGGLTNGEDAPSERNFLGQWK
ncbi:hypothetical protein N7509_000959 [Penicillium cosmopolitanum]|uniref:NAD(P)-binding domain-containing protein n=1 Tax=Penicillium cosmopolitanum TaxID=1131564 RepID=A0A9X0BEK5_9EURO|nr:uncharacterized protein N7509_000959 [Penicillium cosmopolitanum]KAJ5414332.1 hypothetical protein N7509_000959 [Penicillium cosmopolitanum]